jgi:hypothetical protein
MRHGKAAADDLPEGRIAAHEMELPPTPFQ